jgi:hypothetical protein
MNIAVIPKTNILPRLNEAAQDKRLSAIDFRVLYAIASVFHNSKSGHSFGDQTEIAARVHIDIRTLRRSIDRLVLFAYLGRKVHRGRIKRRLANNYWLNYGNGSPVTYCNYGNGSPVTSSNRSPVTSPPEDLPEEKKADFNGKREEGKEASKQAMRPQFYAEAFSEELAAWDRYRLSLGMHGYPRDKRGGWWVPDQWPPTLAKPEAAP